MMGRSDVGVAKGQLGFSSTHRNWMMLALNEQVEAEPFDPAQAQTNYGADTLNLQVRFFLMVVDWDVAEESGGDGIGHGKAGSRDQAEF